MATLTFVCGLECQTLAAQWTATGTAPTIQSTIARHGGSAARVTTTAQQSYYFGPLAGITTMIVSRVFLYFVSLPAATPAALYSCRIGATDAVVGYNQTNGKFTMGAHSGAKTDGVTVAAAGQWYCIDVRVNTVANPWVINWQIDGVDQGNVSPAIAAGNATQSISIGPYTTATLDIVFDDIAVSATSGDYPIGPGAVRGYVPYLSGTHSQGLGAFTKTDGTTAITNGDDSWNLLDELPPGVTDFVRQTTIATAGYVEYAYASNTAPDIPPRAVEQLTGVHAFTAASCDEGAKLYDGTTEAVMYAATAVAVTTAVFRRKCWALSPSATAWTTDQLRKARLRWGYATDATPDPCLDWSILEAEFPSEWRPYVSVMPSLIAQ